MDTTSVDVAQLITAIAATISSISVLAALLVARTQLRLLINTRRLESSVAIHRDFATHWSDIRFIIREFPAILDKYSGNYDAIPVEITDRVMPVLSFFERVGVLVDHGIVEKEIFFDLIGQSTPDTFEACSRFIEYRRRRDPRRYENFEILVEVFNGYKVIYPTKIKEEHTQRQVDEMRKNKGKIRSYR